MTLYANTDYIEVTVNGWVSCARSIDEMVYKSFEIIAVDPAICGSLISNRVVTEAAMADDRENRTEFYFDQAVPGQVYHDFCVDRHSGFRTDRITCRLFDDPTVAIQVVYYERDAPEGHAYASPGFAVVKWKHMNETAGWRSGGREEGAGLVVNAICQIGRQLVAHRRREEELQAKKQRLLTRKED